MTVKADREGGRPLELSIEELDINGYTANQGWGRSKFLPPCIFYAYTPDQPSSSGEIQVTCRVDAIFRSKTICSFLSVA